MALFTGTAAKVSANHLLSLQDDSGPFVDGANLYIVVGNELGGAGTVAVFKSTDAGVTWAQQDVANTPNTAGVGFLVAPDLSNRKLHIVYSADGANQTPVYILFDTSTDLYGAPVVNGVATGLGISGSFVRLSTGQLAMLCRRPPQLGAVNLDYVAFTAGAWVAAVNIYTDAALLDSNIVSVCVDSSDRQHIFFFTDDGVGGPYTLNYINRTAAGVVSAVTAIVVTPVPGGIIGPFQGSVAKIWNSRVIFGNINVTANDPHSFMEIYDGAPLAAPVFTRKTVSTNAATDDETCPAVLAYSATELYLLWTNINAAATTFNLYYSVYDGTSFSAPSPVFWDAVANPVPNPPSGGQNPLDNFAFSSIGLDGARLVVVSNCFFNAATGDKAAFFFGVTPTPASPASSGGAGGSGGGLAGGMSGYGTPMAPPPLGPPGAPGVAPPFGSTIASLMAPAAPSSSLAAALAALGAAIAPGLPAPVAAQLRAVLRPRRILYPEPPDCPFVDLYRGLVFTRSVPASTILLDEKQIVGPEWFLLKVIAGPQLDYFMRFLLPDGSFLSNARVHARCYMNTGGRRLVIDPPHLIPPGQTIDIELENQTAAAIGVVLVFEGVERRFLEEARI